MATRVYEPENEMNWVKSIKEKLQELSVMHPSKSVQEKFRIFRVRKSVKNVKRMHFQPELIFLGLFNKRFDLEIINLKGEKFKLGMVSAFLKIHQELEDGLEWDQICELVVDDPEGLQQCYYDREEPRHRRKETVRCELTLDAIFLASFLSGSLFEANEVVQAAECEEVPVWLVQLPGLINTAFGLWHLNKSLRKNYHKIEKISIPSTTRLREAGIHVRGDARGTFDLVPIFKPGILKATLLIPTFSVIHRTEILWKNMVAYQSETVRPDERGSVDQFIYFLKFMDELINTHHDVFLLRKGRHPVIPKNLLGTEKDVADLFNTITQQYTVQDPHAAKWVELRSQIDGFVNQRSRLMVLEFFRKMQRTISPRQHVHANEDPVNLSLGMWVGGPGDWVSFDAKSKSYYRINYPSNELAAYAWPCMDQSPSYSRIPLCRKVVSP
ncbi:unnamed protein product [Calypogeia fissa]